MELTAEIYLIGLVVSAVTAFVSIYLLTPFVFRRVAKSELSQYTPLIQTVQEFVNKEGSQEQMSEAVESMISLGGLASNANTLLDDDTLLDPLLTEIARRGFRIAKASMMGTASGDVKKAAYAEKRVTAAIIDGAKEFSPELGFFLKLTGLDAELKEDPELFGYIMRFVNEKGLMNLLGPSILNQQTTAQQEQVVRDAVQGIDF